MISVIVPIYNTEKYLPQCLDSILGQTYQDLEVVCVNDGSPGNCLEILESYRAKDGRVKIVNKRNEGVEKAREVGLINSVGGGIMFIDSDDWLEGADTIEIMQKSLIETDSDYVEVCHQRVMDRHGWIKKRGWGSVYGIIEQPELFDKYYISYFGINILNVNIWGKLYKRDVLERANLKSLGVSMGEDLCFNIQVFPHLKKICCLNRIGYNYRFGGMTTKYNQTLLKDIKKEFVFKEELIRKYSYEKAFYPVCIEMKNVLKTEICQMIIYKVGSKQEILKNIESELSDSIWERVSAVGLLNKNTDSFYQALIDRQTNLLYSICELEVEQNKWRRRMLKMISFVFTHI